MRQLKSLVMAVFSVLLVSGLLLTGCDKTADEVVVDSGTYEGTIAKVNPPKKEIYVDSQGRELELYFTDTTKLSQGDQPADFSALKEGQKVQVEVKKVGQRLDPVSVNILE